MRKQQVLNILSHNRHKWNQHNLTTISIGKTGGEKNIEKTLLVSLRNCYNNYVRRKHIETPRHVYKLYQREVVYEKTTSKAI